jgi:hypothetical protein
LSNEPFYLNRMSWNSSRPEMLMGGWDTLYLAKRKGGFLGGRYRFETLTWAIHSASPPSLPHLLNFSRPRNSRHPTRPHIRPTPRILQIPRIPPALRIRLTPHVHSTPRMRPIPRIPRPPRIPRTLHIRLTFFIRLLSPLMIRSLITQLIND